MNLKVGDHVVVIAGKDKGKDGKIIKTLKNDNKKTVIKSSSNRTSIHYFIMISNFLGNSSTIFI